MSTLQEKYKYNPFLEYKDELKAIIKQNAYSPEVSNMLRLSFPIMIEYYGHEYKDILFNTLKNVPIRMAKNGENILDIVNKYTPKNIEISSKTSAVGDNELKKACGVHSVHPILEQSNQNIVLTGKSEVIAFKNEEKPIEILSTFVHELSHAFKSQLNNMNLLEDEQGNQILITRSGISTVYSKVYLKNSKIVIEDFKEENLGLEEGINTFDESNILTRILKFPKAELPIECQNYQEYLKSYQPNFEYSSTGYVQESLCAEKLFTKCGLASVIRKDQFIGTNLCEEKYNSMSSNLENNWKNLNQKIDISVRNTYARYQHIFDPNWFAENQDNIIHNLTAIHSMIDEIASMQSQSYLNYDENK